MIHLILLMFLAVEQEQKPAPPEALASARDALKRAEQAALAVDSRADCVKLLAKIAEEQVNAQQLDEARRLLKEADELFTSSKSIKPNQRSSCLIPMVSAYTQLDDMDAITRWMEKHSKEKLKLPATWMIYLAAAKKYEQLEKVRAKLYANGYPDADSFYLSLSSVGQLAFHHYQQGNQREVERLLKLIQGSNSRTSLFYRNTFAAQACWQLKQGQARYAASLLQQAEYWQRGYEKAEKLKPLKERQLHTWAKLQARAGDASRAKATLLTLGIPQPEKLTACFVNSSWDDLNTCTRELALSTNLKSVSDFVTGPFGEKSLPEDTVVLSLKSAAESIARMQGETDAVPYWKATHAAIKNEQLHHPLTLAKIYHQLYRIDQLDEYRQKALEATEHSIQLCTTYLESNPERKNGWKLLYTCYELVEISQVERVMKLFVSVLKRVDSWAMETEISPKVSFELMFGVMMHDHPATYLQVNEAIASMKHPRSQAESYLGLARGILQNKKRPERELFDASL